MLLVGLLLNILFSTNTKDTSFIKSYNGLPVSITIRYAKSPKYNLLVLPGYGFDDLQWCTKTTLCEKAKRQESWRRLLKSHENIYILDDNGNTLLEYACLKKDPNIIAFMASHGSNMQKHLFFRKGDTKHYLHKSDIDMAILLKLI